MGQEGEEARPEAKRAISIDDPLLVLLERHAQG